MAVAPRPAIVRSLAPCSTTGGRLMLGLEDRLRQVEGVSSIRVELGENGVDSIKVEVREGVQESEVLEEIRRVLVAYGWRTRRPEWLSADDPMDGDARLPRFARVDELVHAASPPPPTVSVRHEGESMIVQLDDADGRHVEAAGSVSPIGAAQAMMKAMSEWLGLPRPDRVAVVMHEMDDQKVVTLMARRGEQTALAAEVATPLLHDALYRATDAVLRQLSP